MSPEAELIEAANGLAAILEADSRPFLQRHRDANTSGAARKINKIFRDRFRKQRAEVLKGDTLRHLWETLTVFHATEADAEEDQRKAAIRAEVESSIGSLISGFPVTGDSSASYGAAIRQAANAGASGITHQLGAELPDTESFIANYVRDNGLKKLTGEIDQTTVKRLASAIADAYEGGVDFDGVLGAVKSEFADFSTKRLQMIAATELNDSYNASIRHFGAEAGATLKSWNIEPGACIVCVENELAGEIPIEDDFPSGDSEPTAHPLCNCSLMVHVV